MSSMVTPVKEELTTEKRSYSLKDIAQLEKHNLYSSIGKMIRSDKPTSQRAVFGKAAREQSRKVLEPSKISARNNFGKEGKGPGAYLPPRFPLENGEVVEIRDQSEHLKFKAENGYTIGKAGKNQKAASGGIVGNDEGLEVSAADLRRRHSQPVIRIGTDKRFKDPSPAHATPSPKYNPTLKLSVPNAPKYTLGARRALKGQDPLVPTVSTTNLVGPCTYFQKNGDNRARTNSEVGLNRVASNSTMRTQPAVSFTKGPKQLAQFRTSYDETYDIKTKAIMAHYDFQYDGGKGLHSGRGWMKKTIINAAQQPLERNKMVSFTIPHSSRQKEMQRGTFIDTMTNTPASVRMVHPTF